MSERTIKATIRRKWTSYDQAEYVTRVPDDVIDVTSFIRGIIAGGGLDDPARLSWQETHKRTTHVRDSLSVVSWIEEPVVTR